MAAYCSDSSNQAAIAAAAVDLGGDCNPASGIERQSEISAAIVAAPHESVGFGEAPSDIFLQTWVEVSFPKCYWHWAVGVAAVTVASCNSAVVTGP